MAERPPELGRERRAHLDNMRQELLAPVTALVGYGELLVEEAQRLTLSEIMPDLERILTSARELLDLVDRLLDVEGVRSREASSDLDDLQIKLRHDLRNPLNVTKGYAELLLEEFQEVGNTRICCHLDSLLNEANGLLSRIDVIVDFSRAKGNTKLEGQDIGAVTSMVANLVRTVRPLDQQDLQPHETGHILVVDDNASNRDLLFRRLSHDGHSVRKAESGQQALETLQIEDFDLILLDLMMPDLNGFQLLERLKSDEHLHNVPVIMISGLQETDSVIRCIAAGAEDYLSKPFNPVLLRARISACLERQRWRDRERRYLERIELEKAKHEALLHNILPGEIVARLNNGEIVIADRFAEATILFADLVDFSVIALQVTPAILVENLNRIFSAFDLLCEQFGIEKIKTIGDAYMAAAGLPEPRPDHAAAMAEFALAMFKALEEVNAITQVQHNLRIGIHTGPVVAGVIGSHRFIYDIWGDTVNLASRLESYGMPGRIHVSEQISRILRDKYEFEPRDSIDVKGIGKIKTAFLTGRSPDT